MLVITNTQQDVNNNRQKVSMIIVYLNVFITSFIFQKQFIFTQIDLTEGQNSKIYRLFVLIFSFLYKSKLLHSIIYINLL